MSIIHRMTLPLAGLGLLVACAAVEDERYVPLIARLPRQLVLLICLSVLPVCFAESADVSLWGRFETSVENPRSYGNPFRDVELNAVFTSPTGRQIKFFGFHDGDGKGGQEGRVWRLRFMPDELGTWSYDCSFSDGAAGQQGTFMCIAAGARPGPLRIEGTGFRFANGADYFPRSYFFSEAFCGSSPHWESGLTMFFGGKYRYNLCGTTFWQGKLLERNGWNNLPYNGFYPIRDGDYTRLDVSAWKHADEVLQQLDGRGVVWFNAGQVCSAKVSSDYVCYAPAGGVIELDLSRETATFTARWLNPRTGKQTAIGPAPGGGTFRAECPTAEDWVLHLQLR